MPEPLSLSLELSRTECVRGESVFFRMKLKNTGSHAFEGLRTFEPENEATFLVALPPGAKKPADEDELSLEPPEGQITGCALSPRHRDGIHRHGPEEVERRTLLPGEEMETSGDVLQWLGELEPGDWDITARHQGVGEMAESKPVRLRVRPAKPVTLGTSVPGLRGSACPNSGAFVHAGEADRLVFLQLQSAYLPKNPMRGLRVGKAKQRGQVVASTFPDEETTTLHVVWDYGGQFALGTVDTTGRAPPAVVPVKIPEGGVILESPLSLRDRSVFIPVLEGKGTGLTVLHVTPAGASKSYRVDLGPARPVAACSVAWEYATRMHFAWVGKDRRRVMVARLFLDDPESGVFTESAWLADAPVLWLHMFLDTAARPGGAPAFEHLTKPEDRDRIDPEPPQPAVWGVCRSGNEWQCVRADLGTVRRRVGARFDVKDLEEPRVTASALDASGELCLLVADAKGGLHYASTVRGSLEPLEKVAGRRISPNQQPGLMAAGRGGTLEWVYLRYIDGEAGRIAYALVEPEGEADPEYSSGH